MSQSAFFNSKILCLVMIGNRVRVKGSGMAAGLQMPGPRAAQTLQMPQPQD